jgi:oligosaccharide translocation protein RFT1
MVQLDLVLTTVLFVSREGFRLALTRNLSKSDTAGDSADESPFWNVAWCSVPAATFVSLLALIWHLLIAQRESDDIDFYVAGILYCLACCVEGCAEPAVLCSLRQLNAATKASAEGTATLVKTLTTVLVMRNLAHRSLESSWPVTAFGVAQLAYAVIYAGVLYTSTWTQLRGPRWRRFWTLSPLDRSAFYLVLVFTLQGVFKHLLTEGDRIVLTTLSGAYDQGVYAMGAAYGGLAARLLLQPIEENARLLWSRLAVPSPSAPQLYDLQQSYTLLVKLVMYIGFVFSFVGVNYTSVLLNLLAGRKWGSNPEAVRVLSSFCVYTSFLAWNGTTEAFVYAVASSGTQMGRLGAVHTLIACVFAAAASAAVTQYGTVGLVAANCMAMLFRSLYSVAFAARYFSNAAAAERKTSMLSTLKSLLFSMVPRPLAIVAFVASYFATSWSQRRMETPATAIQSPTLWMVSAAQHVSVGVACATGLASVVYVSERDFLRSLRSMVSNQGSKKQE